MPFGEQALAPPRESSREDSAASVLGDEVGNVEQRRDQGAAPLRRAVCADRALQLAISSGTPAARDESVVCCKVGCSSGGSTRRNSDVVELSGERAFAHGQSRRTPRT